jgi:hypothetical protein
MDRFVGFVLESLGSTAVTVAVLWLAKSLILERLKSAVAFEYAKEVEKLQSITRENAAAIQALQSGALARQTARYIEFDKRRLAAAEKLWRNVVHLGTKKIALTFLSTLKLDACAAEAQRNQKFREVMSTIAGSNDALQEFLNGINADEERPFVSPYLWAIYTAYSMAVIGAVMQIQLIASGIGEEGYKYWDKNKVLTLLKETMPHRAAYIEEHGMRGIANLMDELEGMIVTAIDVMLSGEDVDRQTVENSSRILKIANELRPQDKEQ